MLTVFHKLSLVLLWFVGTTLTKCTDDDEIQVKRIEVTSEQYTIGVNEYSKPNNIGINRNKRNATNSTTDAQTSTNKSCIDKFAVPTVHGRRDQKAMVIDLARIAELSCHFCDDSAERTLQAMVWFKFKQKKEKEESIWQAREVKLDTHDDENLNRIYVTINHNLIIKDFQPQDVGTYFCEPYQKGLNAITHFAFKSKHLDSTSAASMSAAWKQLKGKRKMRFLYHLDIELPMKAVIVSSDGFNHPKAAPPLESQDRNWIAYTKWEEWGDCSACGIPGERQKRGQCMVNIRDRRKLAKPPFLDHIFRFFLEGVPCHSSFFFNFPHIMKRKIETMVEECIEECSDSYDNMPEVLDVGKIEFVNTGSEVNRIDTGIEDAPIFNIKTRVGKRVVLICPDFFSNTTEISKNASVGTGSIYDTSLPEIAPEKNKSKVPDIKSSDEKDENMSQSEKNRTKRTDGEDIIQSNNYDNYDNASIRLNSTGLTRVIWKNGTQELSQKYLLNKTRGRIYVNSLSYLNITNVSRYDNHTYSCWQNGKPHALYYIEMKHEEEPADNINTFLMYLSISYIFDFIIFLVIVLWKFRKKTYQVQRSNKKKKKHHSRSHEKKQEY